VRSKTLRSIRYILIAIALLAAPAASFAQVSVGISVNVAPPEIPVYEQPICPGDGYIWAPGYWGWADDDYYWIPGTWVEAPEVGFLWTPGYWGWGGSAFIFHEGYWGPTVGFYGGINYGFGYFGDGFVGGRWDGGHFFYNRAVMNVNVTVIHNVYNENVVNRTDNRVSYNGGRGGIEARPTPQQEAAEHERHVGPVSAQVQHMDAARSNRDLRYSVNHGKPAIAATSRPGEFTDRGAVTTRTGADTAAGTRENTSRTPAVHPKDLPPAEKMAAPNTGNAKLDQRYQQQQEKMAAQQDQERQKLEQKQDQEHQRLTQQKADDARQQQVEQRHQQQTQQLEARHTQQQQHLQQQETAHTAAPRASAPERK